MSTVHRAQRLSTSACGPVPTRLHSTKTPRHLYNVYYTIHVNKKSLCMIKITGGRASIEYVCRLLASFGIQLSAETLRQAKFDGAAVSSCNVSVQSSSSMMRAACPAGCTHASVLKMHA